MANKLITIDEAAASLSKAITNLVGDLQKQGVPNTEIASVIEDFFACMGGFPMRVRPQTSAEVSGH
jgi:predicted unusual protein kinase regulating ubiquinone biosynthesis (AarF/ABC1/UbiB family)